MYQIRLPSPQLLGVEQQDKQGDTYEMTFKILFLDELGKMQKKEDFIKSQLEKIFFFGKP
jgi:hypothetical protein